MVVKRLNARFHLGCFQGKRYRFKKEYIDHLKTEIEKMPKDCLVTFALQRYVALDKLMEECHITPYDQLDFIENICIGIREIYENNTRNS